MKKTVAFYLISLYCTISFAQSDTIPQQFFKDDVVVSVTRAKENISNSKLTKAEISQLNKTQDLPFLLDQQLSIVTTSDAGTGIGYTSLRIRGSDQSRINVMINGVPVNDAESQNVFWVDLPDIAASAENITIQRGVGASTLGTGSFGGSVSIKTDNPNLNPFVEMQVMGGSFNTLKTSVRFSTGLINKKFFVEGRGSWIQSNGYIDRASSRLGSYFIQAGLILKKDVIKLIHFSGREKTYQAWYGLPEDSLQTNRTFNLAGTDYFSKNPAYRNQIDRYTQDYFQLVWNRNWNSNISTSLVGFLTYGRGYYEEYKVKDYLQKYIGMPLVIKNDTFEYANLVRQRWLKNIYTGLTASYLYSKNKLKSSGGILASAYLGQHFGKTVWTEFFLPPTNNRYYQNTGNKWDVSAFNKVEYLVHKNVELYADIQYRFVQHIIKGNDNQQRQLNSKNTFHFFNPKAGIIVKWNGVIPGCDHTVWATYGMANREPSRDDLTEALQGVVPKPEQLHDIELGWKTKNKWFSIMANGFYMHYKNQLVLNGNINDVGNPIRVNVPVSYRGGVEMMTELTPLKWITMVAQATWSENKITQFREVVNTFNESYERIDTLAMINNYNNTTISFSPNWVVGFELKIHPYKKLLLSLTGKYISKQYLDNTQNENRIIPSYFYMNASVTYTFLFEKNRELELFFITNNLLNSLYVSNGYTFRERYVYADENNIQQLTNPAHYNYYFPQATINFLGGFRLRF